MPFESFFEREEILFNSRVSFEELHLDENIVLYSFTFVRFPKRAEILLNPEVSCDELLFLAIYTLGWEYFVSTYIFFI